MALFSMHNGNIKKISPQKIGLEKNYSLEKADCLADLSLNTVVRLESGTNKNPIIDTLTKIPKAFGMSVGDSFKK